MRVIRVDDDVWRALQKKALPFEDTPNSVLRRALRVDGPSPQKNGAKRITRGERTAQAEFRLPILRVLYENGGSGKTVEVLDRVGVIIGSKLTNADRAKLTHGEIRWRNTAQWERNVMAEEGLLKKNSPRGVWELTDKGIKIAERGA
jgi:hypothetical protein